MATTLSKTQIDRRAAAESVAASVKTAKPAPIAKESVLCDLFIEAFNKIDGWTCYPEGAGFDVLVVHEDGRQIGVEAKLSLNAKVADQILPGFGDEHYGRPGPDHRVVIVSRITDASEGIEKMLRRLGVSVLCPRERWGRHGYELYFDLKRDIFDAESCAATKGLERLFDWWPAERCRVPAFAQALPAGVPSPVRLTPWKESAIKLVALMRSQGFVTVKQIAEHGMGATKWTQPANGKPSWLIKGAARGQWVETVNMPPFDKQHPELYAIAVEALAAKSRQEFELR